MPQALLQGHPAARFQDWLQTHLQGHPFFQRDFPIFILFSKALTP